MKLLKMGLLLACVILFSVEVFAEKGDKAPGYILDKEGLEIKGTITIGSLTDNEVKVKFKKKGTSKVKSYKPSDIKGYGFHETKVDEVGKKFKIWKHFETQKVDYPPKPFAPKVVFMHREVDGTNKLFCYYIEQRANIKEPLRYVYYVKSRDGELKKVEKKEFVKFSTKFFKSYTAMVDQIGDSSFKYINLSRMVNDFNYWLENDHDPAVYKLAPNEYSSKRS